MDIKLRQKKCLILEETEEAKQSETIIRQIMTEIT